MLRAYWNCPAEFAPELVARVTRDLESRRLPYLMKCPAAPELYDRADAVVVYLDSGSWRVATASLAASHQEVMGSLRLASPPLTLRLGVGVAAAEDPGDGRSFGQSRAMAVAHGLIRATAAGHSDDAAITEVVIGGFPSHDISPTRPYLRARSHPALISGW
jgi:hypothetical protein